ncbi:nuclease-related domain-containing protein [Thalassotalea nanhaiensis]|uniref:Nuclease-related domain-containing protein n=1 Tax=Thalassotalea nanhaiensis TaxID=3065648 RepID=A0ABY9TH04_9GAMM|nr:nuclease-related domain-containing protein [Colwelliaceae bacterium SQ345]
MKWIFLCLVVMVFPAKAIKQYTESSCILLKQQVTDYKRRLGKNSPLYAKTKASFDIHCQSPIVAKRNGKISLGNHQTKQNTNPALTQTKQAPTLLSEKSIQVKANQSDPLSQLAYMFMPIFLLLFFGLMALYYFKKKLPEIKGWIGENHVRKGLKKYLDETKYTIINDVTLPLEDGGTTQIDHIVVSTFGVFVIETKNMSGWIFGNERQAKWTQTIHRSKYPFQNPLRQNYKHTKTLAHLLDMPHEKFHSVVVFTPNAELKTKMPNNVGYLKEMLVYIKSFDQEALDNKNKLEILDLVKSIKLDQGRKTNKEHVKYLKEEHKGNAAI